jgi:antitoxin component of MazEF toxin-antitoxin module
MAIRKKLTKVGNSCALLIDRPILDLLDITDKTTVEITMGPDGKCLIVRPVEDDDKNRRLFEAAVKETKKQYGGAMKKLAAK